VGLALALLAVLVAVLVPPGYMTAAGAGGPSLVICTGHGPLTLAPGDQKGSHKAPKARPNSLCAFTGHGVAVTDGSAPVVAVRFRAVAPAIQRILADLTPGRGLAAPPPPSQAPPAYL
jgi:hypothetical protein